MAAPGRPRPLACREGVKGQVPLTSRHFGKASRCLEQPGTVNSLGAGRNPSADTSNVQVCISRSTILEPAQCHGESQLNPASTELLEGVKPPRKVLKVILTTVQFKGP